MGATEFPFVDELVAAVCLSDVVVLGAVMATRMKHTTAAIAKCERFIPLIYGLKMPATAAKNSNTKTYDTPDAPIKLTSIRRVEAAVNLTTSPASTASALGSNASGFR